MVGIFMGVIHKSSPTTIRAFAACKTSTARAQRRKGIAYFPKNHIGVIGCE